MSTKKVIVIVFCFAIILACVYVPWKADIKGSYYSRGVTISLNYSFIWAPPEKGIAVVDFQRVMLELVGITAFAGLAFALIGVPKR